MDDGLNKFDANMSFAREIYDAAMRVSGVPWKARWMTAIACLESGWGRHIPAGSFNCVGYEVPDAYSEKWAWQYASEGGTGRKTRYRRFRDWDDCMSALFYLIEKSRLYRASRDASTRSVRVSLFSRVYCPVNPGHGSLVLRIMRDLKEEGVGGELV